MADASTSADAIPVTAIPVTAVAGPRAVSALAAVRVPGRQGDPAAAAPLRLCDLVGLEIVQVAAWPDTDAAVAAALPPLTGCPVPDRAGIAGEAPGPAGTAPVRTLWMGPERYWVVSDNGGMAARLAGAFPAATAVTLDLSHARTVLRLSGDPVRAVLAKGLPVDTDPRVLPPGAVVQSQISHIGVTLHRRVQDGIDGIDLYVFRGFAQHFWEWLTDAAAEFGVEVD